jgi:hypothetical protein
LLIEEAMKFFRNLLFTLVVPYSLSPFAANAQYENMSPQSLLDELATTLNLTRETEAAINANLVIKQEYDREKANYDNDVEAYNTVLRRFNAEVELYDTECNRQLSVAELNAYEAWEDELAHEKVTLDQRLEQLNQAKAAYNQKVTQWNQKESARAAQARELLAKYDKVDANTKLLIERLNSQDVFKSSNQNCSNSPGPEAVHQCFLRILNSSP